MPAPVCLLVLIVLQQAPPATPPAAPPDPQETRAGGWRLADSASLYLREHAGDPVEWYPWGDEAFARARELDRPVFLSSGYSSCHWCHVMHRESFADPALAALLNEKFVCIKLDREDLPHIDAIYLDAVQALIGHGGWPLSVFLTPDREPFFGGTYFPPVATEGRPGFGEILGRVHEAWRTDREKVLESGRALLAHVAAGSSRSGEAIRAAAYVERGLAQVRERYDTDRGGWRGAPKFPDPRLIEFLIASARLGGPEEDLRMALGTLAAMRAGGIYDQIRGGFHRYAVDAEWAVPHFEKMLYSQGLLGEAYAEAFRLTGEASLAETARGTLDALLLDFRLDSGAFAASFDADSGGSEGTYYVWTPGELFELLGEEKGRFMMTLLGISETGNFEGGGSVPSRRIPLDGAAQLHSMGREQAERIVAEALRAMVERRATRPAPRRDDKAILGWNATAISALAKGAVALREDRYRRAAEEALRAVRAELVREDGFVRRSAAGRAEHPAALEDAALYLKAVLDLYEASFDPELIAHAREIAGRIDRDFGPGESGGAFFESPAGLDLPGARRKQFICSALPSGAGVHARNLLRLHALTAEKSYLAAADAILAEALPATAHAPGAAPELLLAALARSTGCAEIAIAGDLRHPGTIALLEPALRAALPFRVVAHRPPGEAGEAAAARIPLLADRPPKDGRPTAWLCIDSVCDAPVQEGAALAAAIEALRARLAEARRARRATAEEASHGGAEE